MNDRVRSKSKVLQLNSIRTSGQSLSPKRCTLYLTMTCNLNCKMCFQKSQRAFKPELSLDKIIKIFNNLKLDSIFLVGGEIFTRKDILEILNYFDEQGLKISFITNATLIDDITIQFLRQMKNLETIYVSLDGIEKINDDIRGKKSYEKAVNFIKNSNLKDKIHVNTVLMESNTSHINEFIQELVNIEVKHITLQYQMAYTKEHFDGSIMEIEKNRFSNRFRNDCVLKSFKPEYITMLDKLKRFSNIEIEMFPAVFKNDVNSYIECNLSKKTEIFCRDITDGVLKINHKGEVMLCEAMHNTYGSLLEQSLIEIWNSEKMKTDRKILYENNLFSLCNRCCSIEKV